MISTLESTWQSPEMKEKQPMKALNLGLQKMSRQAYGIDEQLIVHDQQRFNVMLLRKPGHLHLSQLGKSK